MFPNQPSWLKKHLKEKKAIPDQITVLSKPRYTGAGEDGSVQTSMPVTNAQLHEGEGVVPNAAMRQIGGNEGLRRLISSALGGKMPMVSKQTVEMAEMRSPGKRNYAEGTLTDMPITRQPTIAAPATMPTFTAPTITPQVITDPTVKQATVAEPATMPTMTPTAPTAPIVPTTPTPPVAKTPTMAAPATMPTINIKPPTKTKLQADTIKNKFKSIKDDIKAAKLKLSALDYYKKMNTRAPSQTTGTGTTGMPSVAGMDAFKRQYDYAAQQADARAAVSNQALGMKMAQNPYLTEGAKNTLLAEQAMAQGAQQSKLAGDAAQLAYGEQKAQNESAMNAMLAAGDVTGYSKLARDVYGINIDTTKMQDTVNQTGFSNTMGLINTYVGQFGEKADVNAPEVQNLMRSLWKYSGSQGEMTPEWAATTFNNIKESQQPAFQAMQLIPESVARTYFGDETVDNFVDPISKKTGYAGFQSALARDVATGFIKYDKASGTIEVNDGSPIGKLLFGIGSDSTATGATNITQTVTNPDRTQTTTTLKSADITEGKTFDFDNKSWTGAGMTKDGKRIIVSSDGKWANVDSNGNVSYYTTTNNTGVQSVGGKTYYNGVEVTANIAGQTLPITKTDTGYKATIDDQDVDVSIDINGKPKISGVFYAGGKIYKDGAEVKSPDTGASFNLTDTAKTDLSEKGYTLATAGKNTYMINKNGEVVKYDVATFNQYADEMTPEELSKSIAALKGNLISADAVFKEYQDLNPDGGSPTVLNALSKESPKAYEFAKQQILSGVINPKEMPDVWSKITKTAVEPASIGWPSDRGLDTYQAWNNRVVGSIIKAPAGAIYPDGTPMPENTYVYIKSTTGTWNNKGRNGRVVTITYVDLVTGKEFTATNKVTKSA